MKRNKKYIKPNTTIEHDLYIGRIICSSGVISNVEHECSELCRMWHFCRDREVGKRCNDKQY